MRAHSMASRTLRQFLALILLALGFIANTSAKLVDRISSMTTYST